MNDELERLWALSQLDEQAAAIRATLTKFEGERLAFRSRLEADRARVEAVKQRIAEIRLRRSTVEKEAETAAADEKKFQSQLPAVKKNEEYQALLQQIASVKLRRSEIETRILERMEEEDAATKEKPVAEKALADAEREVASRVSQVDREEGERRAELAALDARRQEAIVGLPAGTRSRYERVHSLREGRAVVAIRNGACGGCFRGQPPQLLQDARRGDRVMSCEGCGRMLVLPPELAAEAGPA